MGGFGLVVEFRRGRLLPLGLPRLALKQLMSQINSGVWNPVPITTIADSALKALSFPVLQGSEPVICSV